MPTYRNPQRCMDGVIRTVANRSYKKGRDDEDILNEWIVPVPERRSEVAQRCPDIHRLIELLT